MSFFHLAFTWLKHAAGLGLASCAPEDNEKGSGHSLTCASPIQG